MNQKIHLKVEGNLRRNDMRELLMAFFPYGAIVLSDLSEEIQGESILEVVAKEDRIRARYRNEEGREHVLEIGCAKGLNRRQRGKRLVYDLLNQVTGTSLKWGTMTGIRPVRIAHQGLVEGKDPKELKRIFREEYRLSPEAMDQILSIGALEVQTLYPMGKRKAQVYINIPFCPTRCSYCSFITQEAGTHRELLDDYLNALTEEIRIVGNSLRNGRWEVESIYVGGGTPTVLDPVQMDRLMDCIQQCIPMKYLTECTVEGGRPDTLTEEKIRILRKYNVDRISVNPQSMHEETLRRLGRGHSVEEFYEAYHLVRNAGFSTVNCDLILGLEKETAEEMIESARMLLELEPENITLHSLFLKKSSYLAQEVREGSVHSLDGDAATKAAKAIYGLLHEAGYHPYYLYRQKYCVNNGENIGFSKPGHEGFYNMAIMSDKRTILGLGAGSTGKIYDPETDGYQRMETVKNIRLYLEKAEEEGKRKAELILQYGVEL